MSHFYATTTGNRGTASRCGTKNSGITAHARGWEVGAEVACRNQSQGDYVDVCITCGSNGGGTMLDLGTFIRRGTDKPQAISGPVAQMASVLAEILDGGLTPGLVSEARRLIAHFSGGE